MNMIEEKPNKNGLDVYIFIGVLVVFFIMLFFEK